jgi:hypothetical protein
MSKIQVQILAHNPSDVAPWVRIIIYDNHVWAIFGDSEKEVSDPNAEPMNVATDPEFLEGYKIVKVNVFREDE